MSTGKTTKDAVVHFATYYHLLLLITVNYGKNSHFQLSPTENEEKLLLKSLQTAGLHSI
ncbi:MAG TPA: hypothetical protein VER36_07395 [Flavisolibacter sp.]|nr:hypothetical protein [Flavisolibacter sp.]